MYRIYPDRATAGTALAHALERGSLPRPPVVLGLPRGGVAVALPVAQALHAPLDVLVVRKIGMPGQPELAIGAIARPDIQVLDPSAAALTTSPMLKRLIAAERDELERREHAYRRGLAPLDLEGKTAVLVDDGIATGYTMLAAVRAARAAGAAHIIAAAPVASPEAAALIGAETDANVFLQTAEMFAIGEFYERFEQLDDAEVCRLLALGRGTAKSAHEAHAG